MFNNSNEYKWSVLLAIITWVFIMSVVVYTVVHFVSKYW